MTSTLAGAATDLLLGVQCHGCGMPGARVCRACADLLAGDPRRVWRHRRGLPAAYALVGYAGVGRGLIVGLKERQAWSLVAPLGDALARSCARVLLRQATVPAVALIPAPSSAGSVRERGLDTTLALAQRAAGQLRSRGVDAVAVRALRKRAGVRDQAGLSARERAENMAGRIHVTRPPGRAAVVVDDVITTGATAIECTRVLLGSGAPVLGVAAVAARGWS